MRLKWFYLVLVATVCFVGCSDDDPPPPENPEEEITMVTLTFSPDGGGADLVFVAEDPDGEGPMDLEPEGTIDLAIGTNYTLSIRVENEEENVTEEIEGEATAHQFFFAWTGDLFSDPTGQGNVIADGTTRPSGAVDGDINYGDVETDYQTEPDDDGVAPRNNLPVGLSTSWATAATGATGEYRVLLKHQPGEKDDTSNSNTGDTDVDIVWDIEIN